MSRPTYSRSKLLWRGFIYEEISEWNVNKSGNLSLHFRAFHFISSLAGVKIKYTVPNIRVVDPDPDPYWIRARNYRPSFRENKPKTLVFNDGIRAFWACFHEYAGL
jgi:hypothetical protein